MQVAHFFWLINIYRWAVTELGYFQLPPSLLQNLGEVVKAVVVDATSEAEVKQNCLTHPITYNLFIGYFAPSPDSSRHQVLPHPEKANPFLLFVNQYVLAFNYPLPDQVAELEAELGVRLGITGEGTSLRVFSESERERLIGYSWQVSARSRLQGFQAHFNSRYVQVHHRPPHPAVVNALLHELIHADLLETVKYSAERLEALIQKYLNHS